MTTCLFVFHNFSTILDVAGLVVALQVDEIDAVAVDDYFAEGVDFALDLDDDDDYYY